MAAPPAQKDKMFYVENNSCSKFNYVGFHQAAQIFEGLL